MDNQAPKDFIDWLNLRFNEHGWSMRQGAKAIGVSHPIISNILTAGQKPSFETCVLIAQAFGFSEVEIFRKAGLISRDQEIDEIATEVLHNLAGLSEEDKREIAEIAQMKARRHRNDR